MKGTSKCISRFIMFMLAVASSMALSPGCKAQTQTQMDAGTETQAQVLKRMQQLENELSALRRQVAEMKAGESGSPSLKTAVYTVPAEQQAAGAASTPAAAPAEAPKTTVASLLGPTTVSGFVDTYYGFNFNHPASLDNDLRFFDQKTNQFGLNMVELIVDKAPDATAGEAGRTGYHVALGYGQAINVVNSSEPVTGAGFDQYLKEAYFSYLVPVGKGLQVDIGKFVTPAGAEVIETKDNWNYTRSLLFYYAIPYFHFGARAKYTFNDKWSLSGYLVNGWNNVVDNNSGKTYGASVTWNPNKKVSIAQNYMAGPEGDALAPSSNSNWRQLSDTVITYTPNAKLSLMLNGDYGRGDRVYTPTDTGIVFGPAVDWWGAAAYAKYAWNDKNNFAVRYEYYGDPNGYTVFAGTPFSGTNQHVQEFTATYTHMITNVLMTRFEYRGDFSDAPIFHKGGGELVDRQNTATIGMVLMFDSRNAK